MALDPVDVEKDVQSGWKVFAMIFLAEFGDRTFFVAMMLATKFNAFAVYIGCMIGLFVCTGLSVFVGYGCTKFLSVQILDSLSAAIFLSYAAVIFWDLRTADANSEGMMEEASKDVSKILRENSFNSIDGNGDGYGAVSTLPKQDLNETFAKTGDEETPEQNHSKSLDKRRSSVIEKPIKETVMFFSVLWTVALAEFLGEVGDRTSIAVILLTTTYSWEEVYFFTMVAFAAVTAIAIVAGSVCAKYLSERFVGLTSGAVFLVFGCLMLAQAVTGKHFF